jgi:hypothetical protein
MRSGRNLKRYTPCRFGEILVEKHDVMRDMPPVKGGTERLHIVRANEDVWKYGAIGQLNWSE